MFAPPLLSAVAGLGLGLSLIAAIGAQNAFVLRQGLLGEHVAAVVAVCVVSDIALIAAGVGGAGAALASFPSAVEAARLGGAAFLLGYGFLAARRAVRPRTSSALLAAQPAGATTPRRGVVSVVATCLALTWLNPHVYLDTVVLLGSVAAGQGEQRWWFGAGASTASVLWFCLLGRGAVLLRPVVARPGAWRAIDAVIAAIMTTLGVGLLVT